jgi:hypothetical protein
MNIKDVHLRYSAIVPSASVVRLEWRGHNYKLIFDEGDSSENRMLKLASGRFASSHSQLLTWLSVYFGEDFLNPNQTPDYRRCHLRGKLYLDCGHLQQFLKRAEKLPFKSHPLWRSELLDLSLSYYLVALGAGINYMPVTLGLFAVSIEALVNAYIGSREEYKTLGRKPFEELLRARLVRYVGTSHEPWAKSFQQRIEADLALLTAVRNYTYGHSLIHTPKNRDRLCKELRDWYKRNGLSSKFSEISFPKRKLRVSLAAGNALGLFKVGLFLNRLLIFWYLGYVVSVPFAEKDLRIA